nr:hypothetical protein [uncultured Comamonas sp.]
MGSVNKEIDDVIGGNNTGVGQVVTPPQITGPTITQTRNAPVQAPAPAPAPAPVQGPVVQGTKPPWSDIWK